MWVRGEIRRGFFHVAAPCLALLAACDGETTSRSGAGAGATAADLTALCEAQCGRQQRCNGEVASTCVSACEEENANVVPHVRADMLRGLGDCQAGLECDTSDDVCMERAMEGVGLVPEEEVEADDFQACQEKHEECESTEFDFSDDECATLLFMTSSSRAKAAACYDKPCEELRDCIEPYEL